MLATSARQDSSGTDGGRSPRPGYSAFFVGSDHAEFRRDSCRSREMCGIAGFLDRSHQNESDRFCALITAMTDAIAHRGPDDSGAWQDAAAGIVLGHRRLSVIDLSSEGHQPMAGPDGNQIIVFNGEIYNFQGLRRELEARGHSFRGHSDTEVMLAAFVEWGLAAAVRRFNGMFAFALWDQRERSLT